MALHLAANGCYGVMLYNNLNLSDSLINEELKKYGKVQELQKGGKNLIFVYYKQYEEARACLDALSPHPEFHAKPAKPRETMRTFEPNGARERAKSVVERGERYRRNFDNKRNSMNEVGNSPSKGEEIKHLRERSSSITNISLEKVDNTKSIDSKETDEKETLKAEDSKLTVAAEEQSKPNILLRSRSKSVGRLNIENESKRAELIKKVIKCESELGGSLDSIFDKEIKSVDDNDSSGPKPPHLQRLRSKSFSESFNRSQGIGQRGLWLSPKPNFYNRNGSEFITKIEQNEPFLLPAITIYEHYVIASQQKKYSTVVVISGLPLYITEEYLVDLCAKFARVLQIRLINTNRIDQCRAYVYVKTKRDAINLKRNIDRKILFCHIIDVAILSDIMNVHPHLRY